MDICLLCSAKDKIPAPRRGFFRGFISYIAEGDALRAERLPPDAKADILVISTSRPAAGLSAVIYDEACRRGARGVLLDGGASFSGETASLSRKIRSTGLEVFAPLCRSLPSDVTPVADATLSGGVLAEYFAAVRAASPHFAVSVTRCACDISLTCGQFSPVELSRKELSSLISRYEPDIFFSPQMMCRYFLYNPQGDDVHLILFDDAETISAKLRLAKKHGASHAFLVYREIADIFGEIFF